MLVKFAVEPDALEAEISAISTLLNCWEAHGVLETLDSTDKTIGNQIKNLKDTFKDRWQNALKKKAGTNAKFSRAFKKCGYIDVNWANVEALGDFDDYQNKFDIALMEEVRAYTLGIDEDSPVVYRATADIEATILRNVHLSQKIKNVEDLAQSNLSKGQTIQHIWEERFQPLAMYSKEVVIVDRYAFESIEEKPNGLFRLLKLFDSKPSVSSVTIYSQCDVPQPIKTKLEKKFSRYRNIKILKVYMPKSDTFRDHGHDRHIRFDDFRACTIGIGLPEALRWDDLERDTQFSYKYGKQIFGLKKVEHKLRKATSQYFQFILDKS